MQEAIKSFIRENLAFVVMGIISATFIAFLCLAGGVSPDDALTQSVFKITNLEETGSGTAFLVNTSAGLRLITNHHVCAVSNNGQMYAISQRGRELVSIIDRDYDRDLCVLTPAHTGRPLRIAGSDPAPKETLYVAGHPLGKPYRAVSGQYYGEEIVRFVDEKPDAGCNPHDEESTVTLPFFEIKIAVCVKRMQLGVIGARVFPGNSGSPVLNADSEIVGVINSGDDRDQEGSFVPRRSLVDFLTEGSSDVQR